MRKKMWEEKLALIGAIVILGLMLVLTYVSRGILTLDQGLCILVGVLVFFLVVVCVILILNGQKKDR